jgi:hypothetical protein
VIGGLPGWAEALAAAGVEVGPQAGPDLAVAPAPRAADAVAAGAPMVLLEGYHPRAARTLRRAGLVVRRYRALPSLARTELLLPQGRGVAPRYALMQRFAGSRGWKRAAGRLYRALLSVGVAPPSRELVTIGLQDLAPPRLIAAAAEKMEVDPSGQWFLTLGPDHVRSRGAFRVFPAGARAPAWVVKLGRVAAARERFDKDERGAEIARRVGAVAAGRAPRLIGRLEVDGLPASVETAAVGEPLGAYLAGRRSQAEKLAMIDLIADWVLTIAATPPREMPPVAELRYLEHDVLPHWTNRGAPHDLIARVGHVPGAYVHGDLYVANVVVHQGGFTAVDWEDAQPDGLALSDLLDFLTGALIVAGRSADLGIAEAQARLLRGDSDLSGILFKWFRRAAGDLALEADEVAALVTLRILDVATAWRGYASLSEGPPVETLPHERLAELWLSDPALGPNWDRWRA